MGEIAEGHQLHEGATSMKRRAIRFTLIACTMASSLIAGCAQSPPRPQIPEGECGYAYEQGGDLYILPCCEGEECEEGHVCQEVGCYPCGDPYYPCCEGDQCSEGSTCGPDGMCEACGGYDQRCCENDRCDEGFTCGSDAKCHQCGVHDLPCCEEDLCQEWFTCGSDGNCHSCGGYEELCCEEELCREGYLCGPEGECESCGGYDEPCCLADLVLPGASGPKHFCDDGYVCGPDDKCLSCGGYDEPCCAGEVCREGYECRADGVCHGCGTYEPCAGNQCNEGYYYDDSDGKCYQYGYLNNRCWEESRCDGWFECFDGKCVNPFERDATRSTSICEEAEAGTSRSSRDWCYWYAAYWKEDTSICENISWGQMRDKCREGENPASYYVLPF